MNESILIEALGLPVLLDVGGLTDAEASAVRSAWRDAVVDDGGDAHTCGAGAVSPSADVRISAAVRVRVREEGDASALEPLLERLSQRVTLAAIEAHRGRTWMLHAAGLALPDGRVVVLVGPSGRGKTTAATILGRRFGYVSDETVAMDAEGRIFAYRKPLSIIERPGAPKAQRAPSDLGLQALPAAPLRLAALVLLDRRPDAPGAPRAQAVDLGDALGELVAQTSYLADLDRPLEQIARLVESACGVQRVVYREAEELGDLVEAIAERRARRHGTAGREDADRAYWRTERTLREPVRASGIARTAVTDAVALDEPDRIAVLRRDEAGAGRVSVMAGIAPTLWRAASGVSRDDLVRAAIAAHGHPTGAEPAALVDAALAELVAEGLVSERRPGSGEAPEPAAGAPRWRIGGDVAWHDSGDRVVVLPLAEVEAPTRVLEGSAALIWRAVAEGAAPSDVVATRVAAVAEVDEAVIRGDVDRFLGDLTHEGLLACS